MKLKRSNVSVVVVVSGARVAAKATNGAKVSMVGAKGSWLPGSTAPEYLDGSLPGRPSGG